MVKEVFNYFYIAAKTARKKKDGRNYLLGAIGIRNDGTMVKSFNGNTAKPEPTAHAEVRVSRKLDIGSTVYVARVKILSGDFAMGRPCRNCQRTLKNKGVKRVYYTVGPREFGVIDFESDTEREYFK